MRMLSRVTSLDYEDDPVEFEPSVGLTMSFRCDAF
jgi:hypothetical protein